MNLDIDPKYNTYSVSIVLFLLNNNESYNKLWKEKYPDTETAASNFFNDPNCGCKPVLLSQYRKDKFNADIMTVSFINENPDCINFEEFYEKYASRDIAGHIFSIPEGEGNYKDFIATLQEKRYIFKFFNTIKIDGRILFTFF